MSLQLLPQSDFFAHEELRGRRVPPPVVAEGVRQRQRPSWVEVATKVAAAVGLCLACLTLMVLLPLPGNLFAAIIIEEILLPHLGAFMTLVTAAVSVIAALAIGAFSLVLLDNRPITNTTQSAT